MMAFVKKRLFAAAATSARRRRILPGFGLTMGVSLFYLGLLVLIPLSTLFVRAAGYSWGEIWQTVSSPRALAAYRLTVGASLVAALVNSVGGLLVAWVLVRYRFPGRGVIDALVDLPFALPTAVAGITLATIYSHTGWLGGLLSKVGIKAAYSRVGIVIALIFIGMPFVIRTLQPVIQDLDPQLEDAAASLGATPWQAFRMVLLPPMMPAILTGFALALARGLGEYGSVVFISGNMPMKTEIISLLIITKLEEYNYEGATALAAAMLCMSFALLLVINLAQAWGGRRARS